MSHMVSERCLRYFKKGTKMDAQQNEKYIVVKNSEGQYSIWIEGGGIPSGWEPDGFSGVRKDCLDHIKREWTDITPLSVRKIK